jgi:dTDP-glucose pyrophosphorylase
VLESQDPKQALKVMSDPIMSSKIEKLIAAGVVQTA